MKILLISLLLFISTFVVAAPVSLQCVTDRGEKSADLIIDTSQKIMKWGPLTIDIVHENKQFITGYLRTSQVGGETWVVNRNTGEYRRASIGFSFENPDKPEEAELNYGSFSGFCTKQQF